MILRHELAKLGTLRSTYVAAAVAVLLSTALALVTAHALTTLGGPDAHEVGLLRLVLRTSTPALVVAAVVAAASVRGEIRDGMTPAALLRARSRNRLLAAKATVLAGYAAVVGTLAGSAAVVSTELLDPRPVSFGTALTAVLVHAVVTVGWGGVGLAAGILIPHLGAAVALVLAVPVAVEPALTQTPAAGLLPFHAAGTLYDVIGDPARLAGGSWAPFVVLLVLGLVLGRWRFAGTDL